MKYSVDWRMSVLKHMKSLSLLFNVTFFFFFLTFDVFWKAKIESEILSVRRDAGKIHRGKMLLLLLLQFYTQTRLQKNIGKVGS